MAAALGSKTLTQVVIAGVLALLMAGGFIVVGGIGAGDLSGTVIAQQTETTTETTTRTKETRTRTDRDGTVTRLLFPGLGCGDDNKTHTGAPGNPTATCKPDATRGGQGSGQGNGNGGAGSDNDNKDKDKDKP